MFLCTLSNYVFLSLQFTCTKCLCGQVICLEQELMPLSFSPSTGTWEIQESANWPNLRTTRTSLREDRYLGRGQTWLQGTSIYQTKSLLFKSQVDKFTIEAVDLGQVFKIHIRHDDSLMGADWYLDQVEVLDMETEEVYMFLCERWLSTKKENKRVDRTFYVKVPLTLIKYDGCLFVSD